MSEAVFFEFDDAGEPRTSYLVCSIPRSGSSLLCELLSATGVAGAPAELFHPDYMRMLRQRWGVAAATAPEYVRELLARKTGPNGVFGAKAHWAQYQGFFEDADPRRLLPGLQAILIGRRDHLRQAVSWVRALQTLRWESVQSERPERAAEFDAEQITRKLTRIGREEAAWSALFDRHGIVPHRVSYEDLVADQDQAVHDVLEFIGVEPPAGLRTAPPKLGRQADTLSEQWVERYLAETAQI